MDLELGAQFFETASWLALLKSRALLPQGQGSREGEPTEELRQALVSYEEARTLGNLMGERLEAVGMASSRKPKAGKQGTASDTDTELSKKVPTVQDAVIAARWALAAAQVHAEARAAAHTGIAGAKALAALDARQARLTPGSVLSTGPWFAEADVETASVLLLALLELARQGTLWVHQPAPYAAGQDPETTGRGKERVLLKENES